MTEAEWLTCDDPQRMLSFLGVKASDRKLRLFAVACCRAVWPFLTDERSRLAVEEAERFAEGYVGVKELAATREVATSAAEALAMTDAMMAEAEAAAAARDASHPAAEASVARHAMWAASMSARAGAATAEARVEAGRAAKDAATAQQAEQLRDIIGNPFRHGIDPTSLTPVVGSVARAVYDERFLPSGHLDNARLSVLSDALEEAGCTDAALLSHLRSPGPHVRGCWALDLILGRG